MPQRLEYTGHKRYDAMLALRVLFEGSDLGVLEGFERTIVALMQHPSIERGIAVVAEFFADEGMVPGSPGHRLQMRPFDAVIAADICIDGKKMQ